MPIETCLECPLPGGTVFIEADSNKEFPDLYILKWLEEQDKVSGLYRYLFSGISTYKNGRGEIENWPLLVNQEKSELIDQNFKWIDISLEDAPQLVTRHKVQALQGLVNKPELDTHYNVRMLKDPELNDILRSRGFSVDKGYIAALRRGEKVTLYFGG